MQTQRFQFTIRRLMLLTALCSVGLAPLRATYGFWVPIIVLVAWVPCVIPGFVIGRARGGTGIIAGALSISVFSALVVMHEILPHRSVSDLTFREATDGLLIMFVVAAFAFVLGLLLSGMVYLVFEVTNILRHPEQQGTLPKPRWTPRPLRGECEEECVPSVFAYPQHARPSDRFSQSEPP